MLNAGQLDHRYEAFRLATLAPARSCVAELPAAPAPTAPLHTAFPAGAFSVPEPFLTPWDIALPRLAGPPRRAARPTIAAEAAAATRRGFKGRSALLKRAADIVAAAVLLLLAIPLMVTVAAALRMDGPGPVFFVQRRVGRGGRPFGCIKLRTMRVDAEAQLAALLASCPRARREWAADHKLRQDPRVSPLGRLVRKLSLDELPQLINVLAGEMSMVGPRPIVQAEIPRYGHFFADYCAVQPGITGLWQVSGRNDVSYGERVQLDRRYSRHASLLLDLRIVLRTLPVVFSGIGSY